MKKPAKTIPNSQRSLFAELREGMAALVRFQDRSPASMGADEAGERAGELVKHNEKLFKRLS